MEGFHPVGERVWVRDGDLLLPCSVVASEGGSLVLISDYGQTFTLTPGSVARVNVRAMPAWGPEGVEDMSSLAELHEGAILHNLHLRYRHKLIYTYIGSILAAVNPYETISGLYGAASVEAYRRHRLGELPPHLYAIAGECYRGLWRHGDSQCVLISGESGAGKTESTKIILDFLSAASQASAKSSRLDSSTHVERAVLHSSPIMEAFGNARTVHNHNSSRFGRFVQLNFCQQGTIRGGRILHCILLLIVLLLTTPHLQPYPNAHSNRQRHTNPDANDNDDANVYATIAWQLVNTDANVHIHPNTGGHILH